MLQMGERVAIQGNTTSYTLSNPAYIYTGMIVGTDDGNVVVRLDEPVEYCQQVRQLPAWPERYHEHRFLVHEVSVQATSCRPLAGGV